MIAEHVAANFKYLETSTIHKTNIGICENRILPLILSH